MPVCDWEKTYTCPYNPVHQITIDRLQVHLVKCRKNHPGSDIAICPFNSAHHISRAELPLHKIVCHDRRVVEQDMHIIGKRPVILPVIPGELPPSDEDWEREAVVVRSYDPAAKARERCVLRKLEGATRSERKEFRALEYQRIKALESKMSAPTGAPSGLNRRPTLSLAGNRGGRDILPLRRPSSFAQVDNYTIRQALVLSAFWTSFRSNMYNLDNTHETLEQAILAAGRAGLPSLRRPNPRV